MGPRHLVADDDFQLLWSGSSHYLGMAMIPSSEFMTDNDHFAAMMVKVMLVRSSHDEKSCSVGLAWIGTRNECVLNAGRVRCVCMLSGIQ